ncbi:polysaccharide biosynthesis protein [Xanthomonas axonopodis pv. begoniae]|nr:polysaccharide biosynthesis protein [Xanthomonas axonopodis pv. begoniae]MBO9772759.1 polysaccharide biosynthesis protein [Xanthomonas axonopodis pv. begoniae]PPT32293.1 polysaccharide biosynthesis protein [Xanthomonas axonopodis pv. begoniae]
MISRMSRFFAAARRSIQLHGGGPKGAANVALRAVSIVRALGARGFLQRLRLAGASPPQIHPLPDEYTFAPPVQLSQLQLQVGVMVHVFYADLIDEFAQSLQHMPVQYDLLVSVVDEGAARQAHASFSRLPNLRHLEIRIVANRGRDIAPLLVTFRDHILSLDVVGHLHTKKSLYTGSEQNHWRQYLLSSLMGSSQRIAWQLGMFQAEPRLGLLYPESFADVPLWAHTWLSNAEVCRDLGLRLGINLNPSDYIDFPAGSMFWGKVDALRPLYSLNLELTDFPEENGQIDGTLHHAMERMLVAAVRHQGFRIGILPADGTLTLSSEGERNWQHAINTPINTRLMLSALQANLVSLDVFDTLVVRPFLTPEGSRAYLGHLVERHFGVKDFVEMRALAEARARSRLGSDADLATIYQSFATLPGADRYPIKSLKTLELEVERRLLRQRAGVVGAARQLQTRGTRLVALSDMYLDQATLQHLLPKAVSLLPSAWYVSCETGWRKDDDTAWKMLPTVENVAPHHWLHVGDNEHSDIQRPQMHHLLTPVHVLRPSALLDVVPALRPLRPAGGPTTRWQDQLWLGLLVNRFADLLDKEPQALAPVPTLTATDLGYTVVGPLVFDYLSWLIRLAQTQNIQTILFLSREGYLLEQAFQRLKMSSSALQGLNGKYLLASRRGTGMPSLRSADDLALLLDSTYIGNLHGLINARLGTAAADISAQHLGASLMQRDIYLPEMRAQVVELLEPALPALLKLAENERHAYLKYWEEATGGAPALVADIGYSGSIQANLSRMTGQALVGAYFALNDRATKITVESCANARYFDGRDGSNPANSTILRHDLLLEALLTAPSPQFSHFAIDNQGIRAEYAAPEISPAQWNTIAQVHSGALTFVDDLCNVAQDESHLLDLDHDHVQIPLQCLGSGRWRAPWLSDLQLDDRFTGRGIINASPIG